MRSSAEWLEEAHDAGWSASELKRRIEGERPELPLPEGTYRIFYADPPWEYDNSGLNGAAQSHYSTMSTDALCALDDEENSGFASRVRARAADDAVLFMWATNPLLEDAFRVMEAWGFQYKTNLVWVKDKANYGKLGFYLRGRHELLLVGTRGSMVPNEDLKPVSVIEEPATRHSAKPDSVYELIEGMYPEQTARMELFARNRRDGWKPFGNEVRDA